MRSILETLHLTRLSLSPSVLALAGATAIAATTLLGGSTMATLSHATVVPSDPFKIATMGIEALSTHTDGTIDGTVAANVTTDQNKSVFGAVAMGSSLVTIDNVIPGDQWVRYITLTNTGTVPADFSFRADANDNAGGALVNGVTTNGGRSFTLKVDQCNGATQTSAAAACGTLNNIYAAGALTTDPVVTNFVAITNTGVNVAPNSVAYLQVTLYYPAAYDDFVPGLAVEGKTAWIDFTWKATQHDQSDPISR
jgi:hypothetical protein